MSISDKLSKCRNVTVVSTTKCSVIHSNASISITNYLTVFCNYELINENLSSILHKLFQNAIAKIRALLSPIYLDICRKNRGIEQRFSFAYWSVITSRKIREGHLRGTCRARYVCMYGMYTYKCKYI